MAIDTQRNGKIRRASRLSVQRLPPHRTHRPVREGYRLPDRGREIHRHSYANGTAVFTSNGDTARRFSQDIEVGMVGVNVPIPVPMAFHSFGGWKASNFGDHNMHGMEGIRFYTRMKTTTTRWPTSAANAPQFAIPTLG